MDEQQYVALPKLYGAPAYARPPRPVETQERPFDPDDLPLEAFRTQEESGLATSVVAAPGMVDVREAVTVPADERRQPATLDDPAAQHRSAPADAAETGPGPALEPRPFNIRDLARRIRPR